MNELGCSDNFAFNRLPRPRLPYLPHLPTNRTFLPLTCHSRPRSSLLIWLFPWSFIIIGTKDSLHPSDNLSPLSWFHSVDSTPSLSITLSPLFSKRLQIYSNELDLNFSPTDEGPETENDSDEDIIHSYLPQGKIVSMLKIAYSHCFHIHTHFNGHIFEA